MAHEMIFVSQLSDPVGVFTHASRVPCSGSLVFVSGMTARGPDGSMVGAGDIRAQTLQTLENLRAVLDEVGAAIEDIAKVTVYLRDMNDFDDVHAVRREFFGEMLPASTMVEVSRFVHLDALIEIEAVVHTAGKG